ncbi:MAG: type II secretion system F family protein [Burkholderiaceae bacterium]|nr:type II secretion system F family protein [Burkholderiaceae bacterium]
MNAGIIVSIAFVAGLAGFMAVASVLPSLLGRYRRRFSSGIDRDLGRAFVFIDSGRLLVAHLVLVAALTTLAAWSTAAAAPAVAVALALVALPKLVTLLVRRRRRHRFRMQVPELIDLIAGGLRAGHGLVAVIAQASRRMQPPASQELALMQREQRMGVRLDDALAGLARRMPLEETVLLVTALRLGASTGGDMAQTLEALAGAVRRKLALEGKLRALTAQGRLQAWVMGLLPFAMLALLALIEPAMLDMLLGTSAGLAVCAYVLVSEAIGIVVIRRIVTVDV